MKEKNKKNMYLIVFVIILLGLIIGITYAAMNIVSLSGTNTIQTGTITMSYTEPTNAMELLDALPMSDTEGKAQGEYFEFNVASHATTNSSDNEGVIIPYEINLSKLAIDSDKEALLDTEVKVHLVEMISSVETERATPKLISDLDGSTLSPGRTIVYETEDTHKNGSSAKVRTYRLRAWIDNSFNALKLENDIYQYKFTVNVNAQVNALGVPYGPAPTQDSCFTWVETRASSTITDYKCYAGNSFGEPTITDVVIPEQLNGKNVVEIANYNSSTSPTFRNKGITSVILPSALITIGNYAFYNNPLINVTIPNSVITIGTYVFYGCLISSLTIGNSVETINQYAFAHNHLTSVTIPNSVITIGPNSFSGTTDHLTNNITSLTLGNSVETIGNNAFENNQLTGHLTIPDSVRSIGQYAFAGATNGLSNKISSLTIGNGVETIGNYAFSYNYLTNVTLGTRVQTIEYFAFRKQSGTSGSNNSNLTSIINPSGRSFDWGLITNNATGSIFITGTITHPNGNITVSAS